MSAAPRNWSARGGNNQLLRFAGAPCRGRRQAWRQLWTSTSVPARIARVAAQWPAGPQRANDKASVDEFTGTPKSCIRASIVWPLVAGFEPGGGLFWIKPFEEMLTRSTPRVGLAACDGNFRRRPEVKLGHSDFQIRTKASGLGLGQYLGTEAAS